MGLLILSSFEFLKALPLLTITVASILVYFAFIKGWRVKRYLSKFEGPRPLPLIGNALLIMNPDDVVPVATKLAAMYGRRVRGYLGSWGGFVALDPSDIEKILTSSTLIDKSVLYQVIEPWLGDGLLLSTGKKWSTRRKSLTPAFHFRILDNFVPLMNDHAQILVNVLQDKSANGTIVEIHSIVTRCALDIICETAMGKKLNCQQDHENAYALATLKESEYFWVRATRPWLWPQFMWALSATGRSEIRNLKVLHDFTDKVIQEKKQQYYEDQNNFDHSNAPQDDCADDENVYFSDKKKFAFLDLLIREQAKGIIQLTDQDIRDEVDTFMFEGHDTTAAAVTWAIFLLSLYPEHQAAVQKELDSIFGSDRKREISTSDLAEMKFLDCCIKESLRLYPSVPVFGRQLYQDFALEDGAIIPRDVTILIVPYLVHRIPEIWPNPEEFQPSRFFPENSVGRNPYAYIPFSAGPRNCIGKRFAYMEEKILLATLFRNFTFETIDTRESITALMQLIMRPKDGIRCRLTPR